MANKPSPNLPLSERSAPSLGQDEVLAVARQFADYLDGLYRPLPTSSVYGRRFDHLSRSYRNLAGESFNFGLYAPNRVDAFALPDGSIRFFSGLLDLLDDGEATYVLALQLHYVRAGIAQKRMEAALDAANVANTAELSPAELGRLSQAFFAIPVDEPYQQQARAFAASFLQSNRFPTEVVASAERKLAALSPASGYVRSYPRGSQTPASASVRRDEVDPVPAVAHPERMPAEEVGQPILAEPSKVVSEEIVSESEQAELDAALEAERRNEAATATLKTATLRIAPQMADVAVQSSEGSVSAQDMELPALADAPQPVERAKESPAPLPAKSEPTAVRELDPLVPGFYLQVAAVEESSEAEQRRETLVSGGLPVMVQRADVNGTLYYRLLVGPYSSASLARNQQHKVERLGVSQGMPFVRREAVKP
ncbi:MAG: SPOR domain-containing protein [Bdellovibrionales bacterium]|nr:SPOR domain-containing protein [Bdellovibrionales bacterium]